MKETLFGSLLSLYEKRSQDGHRTPLEDFCTESLVGLLRLYNLEKDFIQDVLKCNISSGKIEIDTQYKISDIDKNARIDIVVKVGNEAIYFIEMKVNAHEGYLQLAKYDKLLSEKNTYEQKILFYCTKYPDKKNDKFKNEFHQFRWNDIYTFFKKHEENKGPIKDFLRFLEERHVAFEEKEFTKEYINMEKWNFNQLNNCIILCLDMLVGTNSRECCDWIDKEVGGYKKFGKKGNVYKNIPIELGFNISEDKLFAYYLLDLKKSEVTKVKAYHPIPIRQDIFPNEFVQEWTDDIKKTVAQIQDEIANQFKNWEEQLKSYGNVCSHIWKKDQSLNKCPYIGFEYICNNHKILAIIEFTAFVWEGKYQYGIHTRGENNEFVKAAIDKLGLRGKTSDSWYFLRETTPDKALNNLLDLCKKIDESENFERI